MGQKPRAQWLELAALWIGRELELTLGTPGNSGHEPVPEAAMWCTLVPWERFYLEWGKSEWE